ncbi:MAG: hypothetical protein ACP5G1_01885 [Nanopusillaceae archaeon]
MESLEETWKKYLNSADKLYNEGDYGSSAVLYIKAIFLIIDNFLYSKFNLEVKDHKERELYLISKKDMDPTCKRILEIYNIVYKSHRETYKRELNQSEVMIIKSLAYELKKLIKLSKK